MCETIKTDSNGFEIQTCGRCGGSGRYSYCTMYGDRCFQCHGRGNVYSKKGAAAHKFYWDSLTVKVREIKPGDYVKIAGKWAKVTSVGFGSSRWLDSKTGEWKPHYDINTERGGLSTFEDATIVRSPADRAEQVAKLEAAIAYQATLTKAGKPKVDRKKKTV